MDSTIKDVIRKDDTMETKGLNDKLAFILGDKVIWIYVVLASFALYIYTLSPGITWGDSAKLVNYVIEKRFTYNFAGGHDLHTLFGIIFSLLPLHNIAYKQNLMSAFFAALALGIFYIISEKIIKSKVAALAAITSLAVSQMFWFMAVINESYSIIYFFFALLFLLMLQYRETHKPVYLFLFSISICFGAFDNSLIIIMLPLYLFFFLMTDKLILFDVKKLIAIFAGLIIGAALPIWFLEIVTPTHHVFASIFSETLGGGAHLYIKSCRHMMLQVFRYPAYLFYQFPLFGFVYGIVGIYKSFKTDKIFFFTLLIGLVADIMFSSSYITQRAFNLMVPSFMIFSIFIGYGIKLFDERIIVRKNKTTGVVLLILLFFTPIVFYDAVSTYMSKHPDKMIVHARTLPFRNDIEYYLVPNKNKNYGPMKYAQEIFSALPQNAILIADFTPGEVLRYYRNAYGYRNDVDIVDEDHYVFMGKDGGNALINYIASELKIGKSVFLADNNPQYYFIPELRKVYKIESAGIAYKIVNKSE